MRANIHVSLEQFEMAEQILLDGLEQLRAPMLRNAVADFYLDQYRRADRALPFDERFLPLRESLKYNANLIPAYDELVQFYRQMERGSDKGKIIHRLNEMIRSNESVALAHFALSNILWVDKNVDESRRHMERAFELDQRFAGVANNLAWLLIHSDDPDPDLERAFDLADRVVQQHPRNGRFRDTLATVLMKQNRYDEALAEFQKALPTMPDQKSVHQKMASIYRAMDRQDLAKQHQDRAEQEE
jgi:Tfp pilus assembly protein PilF